MLFALTLLLLITECKHKFEFLPPQFEMVWKRSLNVKCVNEEKPQRGIEEADKKRLLINLSDILMVNPWSDFCLTTCPHCFYCLGKGGVRVGTHRK